MGRDRWRGGIAARRRVAMALTLLAGLTGTARADSIDGRWCSADGRHLEIRGPRLTTPGGALTAGDYSCHAFSYVVPAGEDGAGGAVDMRLMSEDTMRLFAPGAMPAVWHRCQAETS